MLDVLVVRPRVTFPHAGNLSPTTPTMTRSAARGKFYKLLVKAVALAAVALAAVLVVLWKWQEA